MKPSIKVDILIFAASLMIIGLFIYIMDSSRYKIACPEGQVMLKADGKDACFTPGVYYENSTVISK